MVRDIHGELHLTMDQLNNRYSDSIFYVLHSVGSPRNPQLFCVCSAHHCSWWILHVDGQIRGMAG